MSRRRCRTSTTATPAPLPPRAPIKEFVSAQIERAEIMEDATHINDVYKKLGEWRTRSEQVKKAFLDDLKSLLSKEQEARWPIVERELRRLKQVGSGKLSGESVDLVRLTEDV